MEPLVNIQYPVDKKLLLEISEEAKKTAKELSELAYLDPTMYVGEYGLLSKYTNDYTESIVKGMNLKGLISSRFLWSAPYSKLNEHIDQGTQCAINFILSDDPAPVKFSGVEYHYTQALLNVSLPHSVDNGDKERVLFKISIFEESYEEVVARLTPFIISI